MIIVRLWQQFYAVPVCFFSIPSVVYGVFASGTITVLVSKLAASFGYVTAGGSSLLAVILLLAIMIYPTITSLSITAIRSVDPDIELGSLALGATKERSIFKTVIPAAKSGVMSGIILGMGRAIGETMAVVMVAGNQAMIPDSILSGTRTLTSNIVLEMAYAPQGIHRNALIATAVVLFVFILIINVCFSLINRRGTE